MPGNDFELHQRLLKTFTNEARERSNMLVRSLIELETCNDTGRQQELIESVFREVHSLKGASRAVKLADVEVCCQLLETVISAVKQRSLPVKGVLLDALQKLALMLNRNFARPDFASTPIIPEFRPLLAQLEKVFYSRSENSVTDRVPDEAHSQPHQSPVLPVSVAVEQAATLDTRNDEPARNSTTKKSREAVSTHLLHADVLRIPVQKLDAILVQMEELVAAKLSTQQLVYELQKMEQLVADWQKRVRKSKSARQRHSGAKTLEGERRSSVINIEVEQQERAFLPEIEQRISYLTRMAERQQRAFVSLTDELQEEVRSALMLPCSSLFEAFPAFVRELAEQQGKEIDLKMDGQFVEIDKRIMDEMRSPLMHLMRNCIDHGIEVPSERLLKGKSRRGSISICLSAVGNGKIEFRIADDGRGIDSEALKDTAVNQSVLTESQATEMTSEDALNLVFESGLSTRSSISDISGRGLGLAIVREKVVNLAGSVRVYSEPGQGAAFHLTLPLTLSTFRGLLISARASLFVIPINIVNRVLRLPRSNIKTIENRETIMVDAEAIALLSLADLLALPGPHHEERETDYLQLVIIDCDGKRIAVLVERVYDDKEIAVKSLGSHLRHVRNIFGATVLGDGSVVPILNPGELVSSAIRFLNSSKATSPGDGTAVKRKTVLVVEDSITSRALIKNIMEMSGYAVKTAVDGQDAWEQLQKSNFNLVISDVEMPRLNGFELTSRLRSDKRYEQVPVVLVTALDSISDRTRGLEAGASAYIVKSSFDQDSLLEAVRRLL